MNQTSRIGQDPASAPEIMIAEGLGSLPPNARWVGHHSGGASTRCLQSRAKNPAHFRRATLEISKSILGVPRALVGVSWALVGGLSRILAVTAGQSKTLESLGFHPISCAVPTGFEPVPPP